MVSTLHFFSCYSHIVLPNDGGAPATWNIAFTEYAVIALLRFLEATRGGALVFTCSDTQMDSNEFCVLIPLISVFAVK